MSAFSEFFNAVSGGLTPQEAIDELGLDRKQAKREVREWIAAGIYVKGRTFLGGHIIESAAKPVKKTKKATAKKVVESVETEGDE